MTPSDTLETEQRMRRIQWFFGLLIFLSIFSQYGCAVANRPIDLALMPVPEKVVLKKGKLRIDESFTVGIKGHRSERVQAGATRLLRRLAGRTGLFFKNGFVTERSGEDNLLMLNCKRPGRLQLGEDETYHLRIDREGMEIKAATDIGVVRGLETLLQLLSADDEGYYFPALKIKDRPRFPWRGLLIDSCRHFMPVGVIKRNIDGMCAVKFNVLHWHLSEDQGFRLESKSLPKLHKLGSDGLYYSQAQVKDVIKYASLRGIRVMPEFDIPGHSTSWLVGYPELGSAPGPYAIERKFGIFNPTFNPTIEATYKFFDTFFAEVSALFPDEFIHIGGDENNGKHWDANEQIQTFMKDNGLPDNHALQAYFNKRILEILTKYNKKMVGWDEIRQPDMPKNIVIQSWRGLEELIKSARSGFQTILSNGYYIDLVKPTHFHYKNDPLPTDSPLSNREKKRILGGEATMWSELVTAETVDSRIWPRSAAIAERLWSSQSIQDVGDMYRRLQVISLQLEELGLTHLKNQGMMLRRLAGDIDVAPLRVLVDLLEPLKIYQRHNQGKVYTSYSSFSRVVDAAIPDAPVARKFSHNVEIFLKEKDPRMAEKLIRQLTLWRENEAKLQPIIDRSPILKEIEPHSQNLTKIARVAIKAIEMLLEKRDISQQWIAGSQSFLEAAGKPQAETELMIIAPVQKMLSAILTEREAAK